ncbi:MAG: ABC transporter ATP-binding protein [Elusimicrobia bacterium]|nr:ABC transporter ATP-binding protein [Elusimicrobiota bacterium]
MPEFAIEAKGIEKIYFEGEKKLQVLKGMDLMVKNGEILAIVGPSGAGKSTLLHILGLMDEASSGNLMILGWNTDELKEEEKDALRNKYIGFLFQFHYLLSEFTVLENVMMPLQILGISWSEAKDKAEGLLNAVGLKERISHFPSQISGGEQQRAALARAMVNAPALLICDEPTGNLDIERGEEIKDLIWRVARSQHTTVLVATHNPEIAKSADRIIHISDGRISQFLDSPIGV